jgi:seryl-tRNA synthetase
MLHLPSLRADRAAAVSALQKRGLDGATLVDQLLAADDVRRAAQVELDDCLAESNRLAKAVGDFFKSGQKEQADAAKEQSSALKETAKRLDSVLRDAENALHALLVAVPNTPHSSVPVGKSAEDNEVIRSSGSIPTLHPGAVPHWDLAAQYRLIDFELGVKITGAGFPVYLDKGARLQRALIQFFLDQNTAAGYREVHPPHFVNEASGFGTGQLPDKEGQMYHAVADNLYAIPTAEVPVTNLYRDVIVDEAELPIRNTAYTPCFRREAGSYGKDVRGLNRLHQFDKVEIVTLDRPEDSYARLDEMVAHVAGLLDALELPYRILRLCGGDMGFTSALTYDFEVWSAAQQRWLEVSSVSNFETYQANRLKLRYRRTSDRKTQLAHTLNGSALALPRVVAALLENHQEPNGIRIPAALVPYTGFDRIS